MTRTRRKKTSKKHLTFQDSQGGRSRIICGPFFAARREIPATGALRGRNTKYLKVFIDKLLFNCILTDFDIAR
jgi:hypothetical protein